MSKPSNIYIFWTSYLNLDWNPEQVEFHNALLATKDRINWSDANEKMKMSFAAKRILHEILHIEFNMLVEPNSWGKDKNGKPFIQNLPVNFNISHSGDLIGIAISESSAIGIDVQVIKNYSEGVTKRVFSSEEAGQYNSSSEKPAFFFDTWSKKEACVKATGVGIKTGFKSFSVTEKIIKLDEKELHIHKVEIKKGYSSAIAVNHPVSNIIIKEHKNKSL